MTQTAAYDFESLLHKNNLKITPQRIAILKEIAALGHATIDEIYDKIKILYPSISLATIYKNIISLQEVAMIYELKLPNQKQRYEIIKNPHIHLVCNACGTIKDMDISTQEMIRTCAHQSGYQITETTIALLGICPKCQTTPAK